MPKPQLTTKQESYANRRKLFKNIWDTAMHMDDKEADIMSKPKVIKTQRLDEVDRSNVGKIKKQRIKNLRHVCNRLLDFCDKQEADDALYEVIGEKRPSHQKIGEPKPKKHKGTRIKKKMKRAKSYPPSGGDTAHAKPTTSEGRENRPRTQRDSWTSPHASPQKLKRTTIIQNFTVGTRNLNPKPTLVKTFPYDLTAQLVNHPTPRRRVIKKKRSKKKKQPVTQATPPGIIEAEKLAELLDL